MASDPTSGGFDLDFRPSSYADHRDATSAILQNVKGELRREMVRDVLRAEGEKREDYDKLLGELDPRLYSETADESFRDPMERIDPRWMGGEYLPEYEDGEVEIARLVLDSVTRDVYSVRARPVSDGFRHRIVDEYDTDWYLTRETSRHPLSLRELIDLIDHATFSDNEWDDLTDALRDDSCRDGGDPAGEVDFVAVTSELYPELARYYEAKAAAWLERRRAADRERVVDIGDLTPCGEAPAVAVSELPTEEASRLRGNVDLEDVGETEADVRRHYRRGAPNRPSAGDETT
jgi:hypothetical protein